MLVHVGDAHTILIVVVSTVKCAYGAIRPLRSHGFRMRDAVEETDNPRSPTGDTKFSVARVNARRTRHRNAKVVGTSAVAVCPRRNDTILLNGRKEPRGHLAPVELHGKHIVLVGIHLREVVLRNEGHWIGTTPYPRRARSLVDIYHHTTDIREVQPAGCEHSRSASVRTRTTFPEFLCRIGEPIRLRTFKKYLTAFRQGLSQHVAHISATREGRVVADVPVEEIECVLRLIFRKDEVQNVFLHLGVLLRLFVELCLGDT
mmetsp:Transcript_29039/g.76607  ORF Transcript_29039/g.76607 Transcript_29039/m.76607 type:complete len:260 (-) Transcript_29039:424-1203(-)